MLPKKLITYFVFVTLVFILANSGNPPDGNTGAPGEGQCSNCHSQGSSGNIKGNIEVVGFPSNINSNTEYNITLKINNTSTPLTLAERAGFQLVILDETNVKAGTLSNAGTGSSIKNFNNRTYWEHNPSQVYNGGTNLSWTVKWTSPANINGNVVKLYVGAIIGDQTNGNSKDLYLKSNLVAAFDISPLSIKINAQGPICHNDKNGILTVEASNGLSPYRYKWSNNATSKQINNLGSGTYKVTVTDALNNSLTSSYTLINPDSFFILKDSTIIRNNVCRDNPIAFIKLSLKGGVAPYDYKWSDSINIGNVREFLNNGKYITSIRDKNNCILTDSFNITSEDPDPDFTLSFNPYLILNENGKTYTDSMQIGLIDLSRCGHIEKIEVIPDSFDCTSTFAIIKIKITDSYGRIYFREKQLMVKDFLAPKVKCDSFIIRYGCNNMLTAPAATDNCEIKSISSDSNHPIGSRLDIGTHNISFFVLDGSTNLTICKQIIDVKPVFELSTDSIVYNNCGEQGANIYFNIKNNTTNKEWIYINSDSFYIGNDPKVKFHLTENITQFNIQDQHDCKYPITTIELPIHKLEYKDLIITDVKTNNAKDGAISLDVIGGTPPYTFEWIDNAKQIVSTDKLLTNVGSGVYFLNVLDKANCRNVFGPFEVKLNTETKNTLQVAVNIYPNPAKKKIFITSGESTSSYIYLYQLNGILIGTYQIDTGFMELDVSLIPAGSYFIKMQTSQEILIKKLTILP